jgi:hypothetical protein
MTWLHIQLYNDDHPERQWRVTHQTSQIARDLRTKTKKFGGHAFQLSCPASKGLLCGWQF